jgi:hypothetical protein
MRCLQGFAMGALAVAVASCLPAFAGEDQPRTYVVAQRHPAASDGNPGTPAEPFKTISRAARTVKPGDTVLIDDGVYRESVAVKAGGREQAPVVFQAAPMASVVVTGAEQVSDWRREKGEANIYSTPWPYQYLGWTKRKAHPDDDYHLMIGRAEQIHVDNYPLVQVLARDKLSRGTFYVDLAARRLYVYDRPGQDLSQAGSVVEASVRPVLWECSGPHVRLRGVRFRFAASAAQQPAVDIRGDFDVMEDCTVEQVNGEGAYFQGRGIVVRRCVFRDNGCAGFAARVSDFLMTGCVGENNNVKNWNRGWEAVDKLVLSRNAVIEHSVFRNNRGVGLWFDIGNENCTVRNCLILNNEDAGIFYEISYGLHAHDNVIIGNGLAPRPPAWGGNGGIALSSSPHCLVERNLLIANKEGLQFREQQRTTPRIGDRAQTEYAVWNHDNVVRNNLIACNRDVQTAGWFALDDGSHWPRSLQEKKPGKPASPPPRPPQGGESDRLLARPAGLCLEALRLDLRHNLYCLKPGQRFYQWGCLWAPHESYTTVAEVNRRLDQETGSRIAEVAFADWTTLDLRVPADSPILKMDCYPRGRVPGVRLGIIGEPASRKGLASPQ